MEKEKLIINFKIPDSKKTKNWYQNIVNYFIPSYNTSIDQYDEMLKTYEFMNNDLSGYKKELDNFCSPLGEYMVDEVIENILPYNKLHNKINVLKGELLNRPDSNKVSLMSVKAIKQKNAKQLEAIRASIDERIALELETIDLDDNEKQKYIEQNRTQLEPEDITAKDWLSDIEIFYTKGLRYCKINQDVKHKQQETLEDTVVVDRMFVYNCWRNGKPSIEIRNPLYTGFHKSPNEPYIQKGDYVWYKKAVTLSDIMTEYGEELSKSELEDLNVYVHNNNSRIDKRHDILHNADYVVSNPAYESLSEIADGNSRGTLSDKRVGKNQGQGLERSYNYESLIWETHLEFKAYKPIVFITYLDDYNKQITEQVSDSFKIPRTAKKEKFTNKYGKPSTKYTWTVGDNVFTAERLWIPRRYEVTRLGEDVIVRYREVPFQPDNYDNPYSDFELSTKGGIFTSRNAKSISLVQRAIPSALQGFFIKHVQNKELSKYQGFNLDVDVDQIPTELALNEDGEKVRDRVAAWYKFKKVTSINFYSGSQNTLGGNLPPTRSPGSKGYMLGTAVELMNLQQLAELIDRETGLMMGISPQREALFTRGTNASDNQQSIQQSHHITEPYFFVHSQIWKAVFNEYLKMFRKYAEMRLADEGEMILHYILEDGTEELLEVTPDMLEHTDIGIYMSDSKNDQTYLNTMLQHSFAFAQNAGEGIEQVSQLIKAITSGQSPAEVHKMIQIAANKQFERQQQMQKQQMESQERMVKMQTEVREDVQQHEIDKIVVKEEKQKERELAKETIKALSWNEDKDVDKDGQLDAIELMNAELDREALKLKQAEFEHKKDIDSKTLKLKEKERKNSI